jgi:hypothetical protein
VCLEIAGFRFLIRADNGRFCVFLYEYSLDDAMYGVMAERVGIASLRAERAARRAEVMAWVQSVVIFLLLVWVALEYDHNQYFQGWAARSLGGFGFMLDGTLAAFYAGILIAVFLIRPPMAVAGRLRREQKVVVTAEAR